MCGVRVLLDFIFIGEGEEGGVLYVFSRYYGLDNKLPRRSIPSIYPLFSCSFKHQCACACSSFLFM